MKILLSSYHNPHFETITEYMETAIRELGHELVVFDDRRHIIPGRLRRKIKLLHLLDLGHINRSLLSLAMDTRPDMVIVAGGHRIKADTVLKLKLRGCRTVLWTIDAPLNFDPILNAAPHYDHIFCQGTEALEILNEADIPGGHWLPMGCSPRHHYPLSAGQEHGTEKRWDMVFVGSHYPGRCRLFEGLSDFNLGIWGPGWEKLDPESPLKQHVRGGMVRPGEWLKIYSESKIVLSVHYQHPQNHIPVYQASPRIFEALACRSFMIGDRQKDVLELFKENEHMVFFSSPEDLRETVLYYLEHPEEREKIASTGHEYVLENHTYVDRFREMFGVVRAADT